MLAYPFGEEFFPNVQSRPALAQLELAFQFPGGFLVKVLSYTSQGFEFGHLCSH